MWWVIMGTCRQCECLFEYKRQVRKCIEIFGDYL